MKKSLLSIAVGMGCVLLFAYLLSRQTTRSRQINWVYNYHQGKWQTTSRTPEVESAWLLTPPDSLEQTPAPDDKLMITNGSIIQGYFNGYDDDRQSLLIKRQLPYSDLYQTVSLKTSPAQVVYCIPASITDQKTGKQYPSWQAQFMMKDGATLETYQKFATVHLFAIGRGYPFRAQASAEKRGKNDFWEIRRKNPRFPRKSASHC